MKIGAVKSAKAGGVEFTVTIEDVELSALPSGTYFDMQTLAVRIDVATAP